MKTLVLFFVLAVFASGCGSDAELDFPTSREDSAVEAQVAAGGTQSVSSIDASGAGREPEYDSSGLRWGSAW